MENDAIRDAANAIETSVALRIYLCDSLKNIDRLFWDKRFTNYRDTKDEGLVAALHDVKEQFDEITTLVQALFDAAEQAGIDIDSDTDDDAE